MANNKQTNKQTNKKKRKEIGPIPDNSVYFRST